MDNLKTELENFYITFLSNSDGLTPSALSNQTSKVSWLKILLKDKKVQNILGEAIEKVQNRQIMPLIGYAAVYSYIPRVSSAQPTAPLPPFNRAEITKSEIEDLNAKNRRGIQKSLNRIQSGLTLMETAIERYESAHNPILDYNLNSQVKKEPALSLELVVEKLSSISEPAFVEDIQDISVPYM